MGRILTKYALSAHKQDFAFLFIMGRKVNIMLSTFQATLSPMLVMFLCMIIGFILRKKKLIPENSDSVISKFENYVFVPALIFSTFSTYCTIDSIKEQYNLIIYALIALAIAIAISLPLSKVFANNNYYTRNLYKYALTFGNFSFMGNAIVPIILGTIDSEILYKYLLYTLPLQVAVYTWGIMILIPKGETKKSPVQNLLHPVFISIILGVIFGLTGLIKLLPTFIVTTIDYCKACMAPMAMILTGFVIGGYSISGLLKNKRVYVATALRLFVIPTILLVILKLLGANDTAMVLTLFAFATPLGLNTVVFPAAYGGETQTGASMAMNSHTLCIITIPLMYSILALALNI